MFAAMAAQGENRLLNTSTTTEWECLDRVRRRSPQRFSIHPIDVKKTEITIVSDYTSVIARISPIET
jgi:hypothetical protein